MHSDINSNCDFVINRNHRYFYIMLHLLQIWQTITCFHYYLEVTVIRIAARTSFSVLIKGYIIILQIFEFFDNCILMQIISFIILF